MSLKFTKMHSLGNDFMVIDAINQNIPENFFDKANIIALSNRNKGIGFDQCLLIEASPQPDVDFFYRIFNADGSEVGQCGNGARCMARFVQYYKLSAKKQMSIATHTTCMQAYLQDDNTITINFGVPIVRPTPYEVEVEHRLVQVYSVDVGNPHAVIVLEDSLDISQAPVDQIGKKISTHALFPQQTNVEWVSVRNLSDIALRVYERGCGETLACGSGAVAAVVAGRCFAKLAADVVVHLPGGELKVTWPEIGGPVYLTGPANFVFEGYLL